MSTFLQPCLRDVKWVPRNLKANPAISGVLPFMNPIPTPFKKILCGWKSHLLEGQDEGRVFELGKPLPGSEF
jgi:hypothetical protein